MSKLKVYIDFEAISSPFNWDLKTKNEVPYAYTIGIFIGKIFKTKTYVVNFHEIQIEDVYFDLKRNIIKNIKKIVQNKTFHVSENSIEFYAFAYNLEQKILKKMFKKINVVDISRGHEISLVKVTEKEMGQKSYFFELKKAVANELQATFIKRRGLDKDGALAALSGYILYLNANKNANKYYVNINEKVLLKELREYSRDDVLRMKYIVNDYDSFLIKVKKWKKIVSQTQKDLKELKSIEQVISFLKKESKHKTIELLLTELKTKQTKLSSKNLKKDLL